MPDASTAPPSTAAPDPRVDTARLAADAVSPLRCLHCNYDLRMHPGSTGEPTGDCPECGCPLTVSRRLDRLTDAPPRHLRQLHAGATWLVVAVAAALPTLIPGLLLAVVAAWRLTAPQPRRFEPARDRLPRLFARAAVSLGVLALVAILAAAALAVAVYDLPLAGRLESLDIPLLVAGALTVTGLLGLWRHLRHLAQRVDRPELLNRIEGLHRAWLIAIAAVGGIALLAGAFDWTYRLYAVTHWLAAPGLFSAAAAVALWLWVVSLRAAIALRQALMDITHAPPR